MSQNYTCIIKNRVDSPNRIHSFFFFERCSNAAVEKVSLEGDVRFVCHVIFKYDRESPCQRDRIEVKYLEEVFLRDSDTHTQFSKRFMNFLFYFILFFCLFFFICERDGTKILISVFAFFDNSDEDYERKM